MLISDRYFVTVSPIDEVASIGMLSRPFAVVVLPAYLTVMIQAVIVKAVVIELVGNEYSPTTTTSLDFKSLSE